MVLSQDGWGRIIALIASADGDLAGAEDALSSALERAVSVWRESGIPRNPEGWLYRVALNARRDAWKSAATRTSVPWDPDIHDHIQSRLRDDGDAEEQTDSDSLPDHRLELLAACAHPDIDPGVRPLLMLSAVMGMTGKQIAVGMALPAATVAARLTRAKKLIADLGIGFGQPDRADLEVRLPDIHEAIYGAFAIDWVHAESEPRDGIVGEALYLSRLLAQLCPDDGESHGLAAVLHLSAARFPARRGGGGEFVSLESQDLSAWDSTLAARGEHHLREVHRTRQIGRFGLEAAIQALHMAGVRSGSTDWPMLLRLHDDLGAIAPSLGGAVSRAAVIAEIDGPEAGLAALDDVGSVGGSGGAGGQTNAAKRVDSFQPAWALRAHILARAGRCDDAAEAYRRAIALTTDPAERTFLENTAGGRWPRQP
ncbi:DUF6596 domain-containing protein [Brevibacterium sp. ZH18]|uniref:RNA polymerase sigma factor n=1 Tax=Brevibacterium sp. ZH18 TaxID=2927784 RepID=UPI001F60E7EC|nr:DUF6596 domain-containing protein [Brevibacterium sp. ZH18]MCI4012023.1 RNA polymerase [Brevibacterium sp. ZH18]